jgi:site-specific DNA recombinase
MEGQIVSEAARSQAKFIHGINVVMARNYIENLREEVKKEMREKAERGIYPSRPPIGYRNNKAEHTIEVDPEKAQLARRMFELYATGKYSLSQLRLAIKSEFSVTMAKGYLDRLLKNPFYAGSFIWDGKTYIGTQTPLVDRSLFEQVQSVFHGRNKPRYRKHDVAFRGLLSCAYDDCMVTAEIKKQKNIPVTAAQAPVGSAHYRISARRNWAIGSVES